MDTSVVLGFVATLAAGGIALACAFTEQPARVKSLFSLGMALLALESFLGALALDSSTILETRRWQYARLLAMSLLPGVWLGFSLNFGRGQMRSLSTRARWTLGGLSVFPVLVTLLFAESVIDAANPEKNLGWTVGLGWAGVTLYTLMLLGAVLVLMNLERTFRASVGTMRWRLKYMILGLGILFGTWVYTSSQSVLFRAISPSSLVINAIALIGAAILILRWVLRAGGTEVVVYPSQAVLQHSLTILLAGAYLLVVGVFAKMVSLFGGGTGFALKAFVVLASLLVLAMLLLSDRVRVHLSRFVSRNFQRPLYNYRTVWRSFTEGTASRVERGDLCSAMVKLVADNFQVLSVTIWTVDEKNQRFEFGASSVLPAGALGKPALNEPAAAEILRALKDRHDPLDLDTVRDNWAEPLRQLHPAEFRSGGHRLCVPLVARERLLGLMVIGDRVGGIPFSTQDFDLFRCVGDQFAASLLNIELSRKLLVAKEFEAFQTMSAFFVHDLKNTASTLSLMLQNFPVHYNDPAFREDALRAIGKSAQHVNQLVQRLTSLRQEMVVKPVPADLNQLVNKVVTEIAASPKGELTTDLAVLPRQTLDPAQMEKVIQNLVLNARDAISVDGRIRIRTEQVDHQILLTVTDTGAGMTPEFLGQSLFRPFQTTKKQGIGIGMFQSKMIVDAHGGRIEAESELGKGTTFRIFLPIEKT